jgi:hypothetical protein
MPHTWDLPGTVAPDDEEVQTAMATLDSLTVNQKRTLILNAVRAAFALKRTGDVGHATRYAHNLLATAQLRGIPAYAKALRDHASRPHTPGAGLDIDEVLARLAGEGA